MSRQPNNKTEKKIGKACWNSDPWSPDAVTRRHSKRHVRAEMKQIERKDAQLEENYETEKATDKS